MYTPLLVGKGSKLVPRKSFVYNSIISEELRKDIPLDSSLAGL